MPLGTDWPCPHDGELCSRYCPQTACRRDLDEVCPDCTDGWLVVSDDPWTTKTCPSCGGSGRVDEASWPDVEPDPQDLANVEWPMS